MQPSNLVRPLEHQLGPQERAEERVVAVGGVLAAVAVEEEVAPVEIGENQPRIRATRQLGGELGREAVGEGRLEQERPQLVGLLVEHLVQQIVGDRTVVRCELRDETMRILDRFERDRGQPERRRPTVGSLAQRLDLGLGQPSATGPSSSRVSSDVIASSAALISTSCPESRYLPSGIDGSDLVARTRRSCGGACLIRCAMSLEGRALAQGVYVVEDQHDGGVELARSG